MLSLGASEAMPNLNCFQEQWGVIGSFQAGEYQYIIYFVRQDLCGHFVESGLLGDKRRSWEMSSEAALVTHLDEWA